MQVDLPQGLCVLGDAATCFNPIYGQGMTVGIKGAILLRDTLQKRLQGRKFTPAEASSVLSGFSKVRSHGSVLAVLSLKLSQRNRRAGRIFPLVHIMCGGRMHAQIPKANLPKLSSPLEA